MKTIFAAGVRSSWITNVAYVQRGKHQGVLLRFVDGAVCFYPDTSIEDAYACVLAPSKGKWLNGWKYKSDYVEL